jgi:leader peptidase (prepilin peptidase) / N-methyltransferase
MNIGKEPLILELVTSLLFGLFAWKFGLDWALPAYCVLAVGLVGLSWIDLRTKRLPRQIIYVTAAIGVPLLCLAAIVRHEPERIWMMLLGAGIALAFMCIVYIASRGGMGDGDVRLSPLLGAYLGWLNPGIVAVGLFFGFLSGAVVGAAMMAAGRAGRKTAVPFGPFLALGTIVAVFVGQRCVDLFMRR